MAFGEYRRGRRPSEAGPIADATKKANATAEHSKVDRLPCADLARRKRLEADDEAWLRWYCDKDFWLPFEKPHKAIIAEARTAMTTAGDAIVAAERGIGKSSVLYGMVLKFALSGEQQFPVYLPHTQKDQEQGVRFWKESLCDNERIAADYPEICAPFVHAGDVAQRLVTTTWRDTGERTGARTLTSMGRAVIVFPDGRGLIGTSSMGGNPRGMHYKPKGHGSIRPTMALIDDVQTDETAISPDAVTKTIQKINGAIRGLKRAGGNFSILIAGTCICSGDVMDHFLHQKRWRGVRIACVERWPDGWDDPKSEARRLWAEWKDKYDAGAGEVTFYRQNKKAMVAGMVVTSPRWYFQKLAKQSADKRSKVSPPVDCFHGVFREYYTMGHEAFMAERQQAPVDPVASAAVRVTPDLIVKRAIGPARGVAPEGSIRIVAGADINPGLTGRLGARITWAAAAFQMHQSECVIAYGIHRLDMPKDPTPSQQVTCVYGGLNDIRVMLAGLGCEALIYDARGWYDKGVTRGQALRYASVSFPSSSCVAIPAEGWPHQAYRPTHKTAIRAFEGCHMARDRVEQQTVTWLAWDADWFNLQQLRAWMAAPGAPGSCIIYSGHHDGEFLNQATTRAYMGMTQKHSGPVYDWARQPGSDDYGDCLAMCRVGAAYYGIGTGGQVVKPARRVNRRSVRHVRV